MERNNLKIVQVAFNRNILFTYTSRIVMVSRLLLNVPKAINLTDPQKQYNESKRIIISQSAEVGHKVDTG
ncbi:hypothetical protein L798_03901 [Zootermopsis nevadensis]|uniref:Uncharacterized protein n=1 Tax=Zootermopsis nevadensis TaxID=136037 RepID=A0A067RNY1_ZOONE|nr:hypothetical protein L798_03901 [Zootermopsis nevadensis]